MRGVEMEFMKWRTGLRAASVVGVLAVVAAVGGIGATSAVAAPTCPSNAVKAIEGRGSASQRIAEQVWTGREAPTGALTAIPHALEISGFSTYASFCETTPSVSYTSTNDRDALGAFRFLGSGVIENGTHAGETHSMAFVASDEAPAKGQIENAEAATTGGVATGANPLIIPVAQTSIAVIVHPPAGCTLTSDKTHGISSIELNKIFSGTMKVWSELASHSGPSCEHTITRVVREDMSNTTWQFKNYLSVLETTLKGEGPGCSLGTWAALRPIENLTTGAPNTTWPECVERTPLVKKITGAALAQYVASTSGTIGYAVLPDATAKAAEVARLQDDPKAIYAPPEVGTTSNCGAQRFTVPTSTTGEGVDWSNVTSAVPTIGGGLYPLCTLTYDLAWSSYAKAGYASAAARAEDVKDFIGYVLSGSGQSIGERYEPLPSVAGHEVLQAAELAASKIG
jgi:ABC-type phosphate transport system substrate-binding protein